MPGITDRLPIQFEEENLTSPSPADRNPAVRGKPDRKVAALGIDKPPSLKMSVAAVALHALGGHRGGHASPSGKAIVLVSKKVGSSTRASQVPA